MTYFFYDICRGVLRVFFRLGFGLEVVGTEHIPKTGGFILACNHASYLDPPLLGAACPRPLGFMARADLFEHPILGPYLRAVHVFPLQRGASDLGAMREAVRRLRSGGGIAIFPEGGRQFSGRLGTAKRGVGLIAETAQVPIVPVLVQGTFQALPPLSRRLRRAKIRVAFGPQISYTTASVPSPGWAAGTPSPTDTGEQAARERHEQLAAAVTRQWHRLAEQLNG